MVIQVIDSGIYKRQNPLEFSISSARPPSAAQA
jgi:hypothetical protein